MDKQKDTADTGEIEIVARVIPLGVDLHTGEPISSLVSTPDMLADPVPQAPWREHIVDNQVAILAILREMFSEDGGTEAQVRAIMKEKGIRDQRWINSQFHNAWNSLKRKDLIERVARTARFVVVDENAIIGIDERLTEPPNGQDP
jgi:hypothetical protein